MPQKTDNSIEAVGNSYLLWTGWSSNLTKLTFAPESSEWFTWLKEIPSFRFESKRGKYTARKEQREYGSDYWIAYVKQNKKLYKKYLGPTDKLTIPRLEEVAEELTKQMGNASDSEFSKESQSRSQL
jgi:hypothetical protein